MHRFCILHAEIYLGGLFTPTVAAGHNKRTHSHTHRAPRTTPRKQRGSRDEADEADAHGDRRNAHLVYAETAPNLSGNKNDPTKRSRLADAGRLSHSAIRPDEHTVPVITQLSELRDGTVHGTSVSDAQTHHHTMRATHTHTHTTINNRFPRNTGIKPSKVPINRRSPGRKNENYDMPLRAQRRTHGESIDLLPIDARRV